MAEAGSEKQYDDRGHDDLRKQRDEQLRILRELSTRGGWRYALIGAPMGVAAGVYALVTGDVGATAFLWACALGLGIYGVVDYRDER